MAILSIKKAIVPFANLREMIEDETYTFGLQGGTIADNLLTNGVSVMIVVSTIL